MADYLVTGKKGNGKGLFCVGVIRDAIAQGKRVATNMDIYLDHLLSPGNRTTIFRVPDRPTVDDMHAIGRGQDGVNEDDNGVLVLDECSAIFNSRSWGDKERQPLLDWLIHSRKLGWDVYYISQGQEQLDKQVRSTQAEYHIAVKRTDKWPIPFVTPFFKTFGINIRFPKLHVGIVRHGMERDALFIERRWYRGRDFYNAYDTQQIFLERSHPKACGLHTVLSPYHIKGRYLGWWAMSKQLVYAGVIIGIALGFPAGGYGAWIVWGKERPKVGLEKLDTSVKATGWMYDGATLRVQLSDGRMVIPDQSLKDDLGARVRVGDKWYSVDSH
ncbi:hypothetical protein AZSI13_07600 [Azospira sp. I13]|uniref:zonular occludens toxin domain-containing protein n=1 Tax=Azospira sp. I13 TaxID=1765050 RepID=UPI000D4A4621|nr:zonular occludens toxin domain-containing protein [Azospira sp. I13]GBG01433.1 hypothetical protein AZSI13_07600 [Azospira sp. I13]